jgi:murein DD-endopeptidase MepM/ murein hydrolase activator NlpD
MDFHRSSRRRHVAAVSVTWRGVPRTLRLGRIAAALVLGLIPLAAVWYLAATAYLVFHDQLLASLISRQTDIQYSYEDRIAALRTELDQATSRALMDRQTLTTTLQELGDRAAQLATRAGAIDRLVAGLASGGASKRDPSSADAVPPAWSNEAPLFDPSAGSQDKPTGTEDHSEATPTSQSDKIAALLSQVDRQQTEAVSHLRDPMMREVACLQTALAETGLSLSGLDRARGDVGGPYVPIPDNGAALGFDASVALLRDTISLHERLTRLIERVPLRRPLLGAIEVTSPFGARLDPFFGRPAMHTGLDLMEPYGGPVLATADGIVTVAGSEGGYGNMVEINHGNGVVTRYAHLSAIDVAVNQKVAAGEIVGRVGSTGRATGPHLHYETRINGEPVDPSRFLKAGAPLFASRTSL